MNKIEKAIIKTLAFFDIFERPLTLEEIWQFLYQKPASQMHASQMQVLIGLQKLEKNHQILGKNQYFCLSNRKSIIDKFLQNQSFIHGRLQKVRWVVKILRLVPFVKNISIINSLSFRTSNEASDIDLLIITKKGRLWTARALTVLLLEIIGQNKNKWYQAGKFCLGFAFDETRLDLKKIAKGHEVHFMYWLANLLPVYDREIYHQLIEVNYLNNFLPNWRTPKIKINREKVGLIEKLFSKKLGDRLEKLFAEIQIKRVWSDPKHHGKKGLVEADEGMLKMHPVDKRPEYLKSWQMRLDPILKPTQKKNALRRVPGSSARVKKARIGNIMALDKILKNKLK